MTVKITATRSIPLNQPRASRQPVLGRFRGLRQLSEEGFEGGQPRILEALCAGYAEVEEARGCHVELTYRREPVPLDLVTVLGLVQNARNDGSAHPRPARQPVAAVHRIDGYGLGSMFACLAAGAVLTRQRSTSATLQA